MSVQKAQQGKEKIKRPSDKESGEGSRGSKLLDRKAEEGRLGLCIFFLNSSSETNFFPKVSSFITAGY